MANVNPTITAGGFSAPAGTVVSATMLRLMNGATVAAQQQLAPPINGQAAAAPSFTGVAPGTYTVTAQAVDSGGAAIGPQATSSTITVTAPNTVVLIPTTISITLS